MTGHLKKGTFTYVKECWRPFWQYGDVELRVKQLVSWGVPNSPALSSRRVSRRGLRHLRNAFDGVFRLPAFQRGLFECYSYIPSHKSNPNKAAPGEPQFPWTPPSSSWKRSSNASSWLSASCSSGPIASRTTRAPQSRSALSTSSMLAAEKFSSPLQIVSLLLNLITHRTNSAAGRACNPSLLTISTSLRMQFKAAARKALSCWWLELPQKHFLSSFKSLPSLESRLAKGRRCLPGIRSDADPAIDAGHRSSPERTPQRSRKVSEMPSYEEEWHACLKFRRGKGSRFHPILACRRVAGGWARTACSLWWLSVYLTSGLWFAAQRDHTPRHPQKRLFDGRTFRANR